MNDNDDFKPFIRDGKVCLPHQCQEWVIGDRKDVEQMITDLQELLKSEELE